MKDTQQFKPNNILLAVDGSRSSKAAAYAATQVASALKWKIHALYVVDAAQVFEMYGDTSQELGKLGGEFSNEEPVTLFEEQGTLSLIEIEELCQNMNVPVTTEMIFGGIPETILNASKQFGLLALGRRGNHYERDGNHLGGNFRKIAHHARIPLLIGGTDNTPLKHRHVLLAYDGSKFSHAALSWTEKLQKMFADVMAVSVGQKCKEDCAWLEERQKEIVQSTLKHCKFDKEIGEPGKTIASVASSRHADLLVMGTYQHSQLREWATHSTLNSVIQEVTIPILAAK